MKTIIVPNKLQNVFSRDFLAYNAALVLNLIITPNFLHFRTLWNLISQVASLMCVAMGMTLVISSGGIDLSVGSAMAAVSIIFSLAATSTQNLWFSLILAIFVSLVFGIFNGLMIARVGIQPIILTLVMQMILRGIAMLISKARPIRLNEFPIVDKIGLYRFHGGLPIQIVPIIIITAITFFCLKRCSLGKM